MRMAYFFIDFQSEGGIFPEYSTLVYVLSFDDKEAAQFKSIFSSSPLENSNSP